ncbi:hypothetical protein [Enteractinococcus helveticum]|uniref:Uncharacterized protein n=1 Tax=Enteractinococcus helveticum TaxID=1837282 RepID=A0A1B7LXI2_9MICC|nr:hypothetical protein [Enteractinococcus helveticum]OAV59891.1 hypothetical protein A6F49_14145 [Enteractinococcus helveticum]
MSIEITTIIIAAAGVLVALGSVSLVGFVRIRRHMDQRFDQLHAHYEHIDIGIRKVFLKVSSVHARFEHAEREIRKLQEELQEELQEVKATDSVPRRTTSAFFLHDTMLGRIRW